MGWCWSTCKECWSPRRCQGKGGFGLSMEDVLHPFSHTFLGHLYTGLAFFISLRVLPLCSSASAQLYGWQRCGESHPSPVGKIKPVGWVQSCSLPSQACLLLGFGAAAVCPCSQDPPPCCSPRRKWCLCSEALCSALDCYRYTRVEEAAHCHRSLPRPLP